MSRCAAARPGSSLLSRMPRGSSGVSSGSGVSATAAAAWKEEPPAAGSGDWLLPPPPSAPPVPIPRLALLRWTLAEALPNCRIRTANSLEGGRGGREVGAERKAATVVLESDNRTEGVEAWGERKRDRKNRCRRH